MKKDLLTKEEINTIAKEIINVCENYEKEIKKNENLSIKVKEE